MSSSEQIHRLIRTSSFLSSKPLFKRPTNHQRIQCFSSTPSRREATSRRLRQRLALPEAPSMRTTKTSGPKSSHVVFNPPSASPNVFHTPLKFLPANDARRRLYENGPSLYNLPKANASDAGRYSYVTENSRLKSTLIARPGTALHEISSTFPMAMAPRVPDDAPLPPPLRGHWKVEKPLTQAEIDEIRRLRTEDPFEWTVSKLKEKFGCTASLIKAIAAPRDSHLAHVKKLEESKARWGKGRARARRDRERRKVLWGLDA